MLAEASMARQLIICCAVTLGTAAVAQALQKKQ
jgi:hypothetical protein